MGDLLIEDGLYFRSKQFISNNLFLRTPFSKLLILDFESFEAAKLLPPY